MWRLGQWVRHAVGAAEFNLGIMAHSFWWEPKGTDVQNVNTPSCLWPWIQGIGMPSKICGMMNIVGYYEVRTKEVRKQKRDVRILHTNKNENWFAKCQFKKPDGSSVFGDGNIINPTLPSMMEAISKGRVVSRRERPINRRRTRKGALSGGEL